LRCTSRALLQIGISDVGVDRREPVQRPALCRSESQRAPRDAIAPDFHVDLIIGGLRKRHPHFAAQSARVTRGQEARGADERSASIGDTRARGGRAQSRHDDPHEIAAAVGLLEQRRRADVDHRLLGRVPAAGGAQQRQRTEPREK
jgi:hypothetical protein